MLMLGLMMILCSHASGAMMASCMHNGVLYNNGDYLLPSFQIMPTDRPGQCLQCRCSNGLVVCENENCPVLHCDTPIKLAQYCCLQCPSLAGKQEKQSDARFPLHTQNKTRKKNDCVSGEKSYKEGASWQPVIGPLGAMACVQCSCKSGEISCKRFQCRELPCSHPRKQFGQCCPVCPVLDEPGFGSNNCLPISSEVFVFRKRSHEKPSIIEYGFIQSNSRNKLELHTWDPTSDNPFQVALVPKANFQWTTLSVIGSTSQKHWIRFTRREKRLKSQCRTKCLDKVRRLEDTLKLYPVSSRVRCHSDEIDIAVLL